MKSMMRKTTMREIRQSFGRYMAIFGIVALGVGFFAGLKVTKPAMVATARNYLDKNNFYDYRLLSTLGFTQEDVDFFAALEGVEAAAGAVSADILYVGAGGSEAVVKAHSLTEGVNGVELVAGRMPEKADECVVDSNLYGADGIGQKIVLSGNNDSDGLELFAAGEYTITGLVQSSLYIQFERGNSSLGNGRVSGFMYLLPEGFDADYFTEIFIKFQDDFEMYSQEYTDFLEEKQDKWEEMCRERGDIRYADILSEAETKLWDAREEFEEKKADAEAELADAKKELDDALAELQDGESKIADAEKEIADAEKELPEKRRELEDAEAELAEKEAEIPGKEQELADGEKAWHGSNAQVNDNWAQLKGQQSQLDGQIAVLEANKARADQTQAQLDEKESQLNYAVQAGIKQESDSDVIQARAEIAAARAAIAGARQQLDAGFQTAAAYQSQLDAGRSALQEADRQLGEAWQKLQEGRQQLTDGKQQIADARAEIADGRRQITEAEKKLRDARKELDEKKRELAEGYGEYEEGLADYGEGYEEFQTEIAEAEQEIADAQQEIADLEPPDTYVLGRDTNVGYVCFESDSDIVEGIANIFPVFFFLVAALVCITTMNRMVEEQRTQIGVLKALGYGESTIMFKYMFYSGSAAVTGCVGGFFMGTFLFPKVIWSAYSIMYNMNGLLYVFNWILAAISLVVSLLCSMGATWLSCRFELAEVAAELMRPKAPKAGKRVVLEYIPFIWKRLKFLHKVSVRNILRYKKRFFMMVIGISGCTALLVTGFGIKDSVANVAGQQFSEIQVYDLGVGFKEPLTEAAAGRFEEAVAAYADGYGFVCDEAVDLLVEGHVKSVEMVVAENPAEIGNYVNLHEKDGTPVLYPEKGEIAVCRKLADTYHLEVGDEVVLRDDKMRQMTLRVSGIFENFIYNYVYVNAASYVEQTGETPELKTAYVNLREEADAHQAAAAVMNMDEASSVTVNSDMEQRFGSMMKSLDYIVVVVILCAAGLAFIVLYNLTNINITERIREIATIKVLGFYRKETSKYVFRENTVLTFIGAAVGLLAGFFLHRFVMNEVNIDMVSFDVHVRAISYAYSVLLTFLFAWIVNRFMSRKLDKINMAESLKSVD